MDLLKESLLLENLRFTKVFQLLFAWKVFSGVELRFLAISTSRNQLTNYWLVYLLKLSPCEFLSDDLITKTCCSKTSEKNVLLKTDCGAALLEAYAKF